jgi:hypothetical protein
MKIIIFFIICFFSNQLVYCQQAPTDSQEKFLQPPLKGTYQFLFDTDDADPIAITMELIKIINSNRHEIEDKTIEISSSLDLFLPSYQKINQQNFILLEEFKIKAN